MQGIVQLVSQHFGAHTCLLQTQLSLSKSLAQGKQTFAGFAPMWSMHGAAANAGIERSLAARFIDKGEMLKRLEVDCEKWLNP